MIEVKSILKLNIVTNFVSLGVLLQQASRLYQSVKEEMGMEVMGSMSDVEVTHHCQIEQFAVSEGDKPMEQYTLTFVCDVILRVVYLLAILMGQHHSREYLYGLVVEAINVFAPNW